MKKILFPTVFAAALAAIAVAAGAETTKLIYALPVSVPVALPYIAIDKGFFRAEGLEVEARMFSSGREGLQALLAGQAQIQSVSETPIVHALIQGNRIATIATVARHEEAKLIVRKDSGIVKPEDLVGKRIATLPGTNSDYFMYTFLSAHGLTPERVKIANMPPPEMVSAYAKGDIDGYFAWEPHIQFGLAAVPESLVFFPGELYHGWATVNMDPDFVKVNPRTTRKILRALINAEAFVKAHKDESIRLIAARFKMDEKVLRAVWDQNRYQVELDKALVSEMAEIGRWSLKMSKSDKPPPNFRQFIHEDYLRRERPKSVSF